MKVGKNVQTGFIAKFNALNPLLNPCTVHSSAFFRTYKTRQGLLTPDPAPTTTLGTGSGVRRKNRTEGENQHMHGGGGIGVGWVNGIGNWYRDRANADNQ